MEVSMSIIIIIIFYSLLFIIIIIINFPTYLVELQEFWEGQPLNLVMLNAADERIKSSST